MVDVERGRTVKDWKPKRLGGGLGGQSRRPKIKPAADPCTSPELTQTRAAGCAVADGLRHFVGVAVAAGAMAASVGATVALSLIHI